MRLIFNAQGLDFVLLYTVNECTIGTHTDQIECIILDINTLSEYVSNVFHCAVTAAFVTGYSQPKTESKQDWLADHKTYVGWVTSMVRRCCEATLPTAVLLSLT